MEFNLDEIKCLLDAFEERNMQKFHLKKGDCEIVLERTPPKGEIIARAPVAEHAPLAHHPQPHALPPHFPGHEKTMDHNTEVETLGKFISSPMVGTFYASSSPGEAKFINVGDSVQEGDVVCIVEAMKVMNEVKATESGIVKEILVEDGHPVEFGTKIFKVS